MGSGVLMYLEAIRTAPFGVGFGCMPQSLQGRKSLPLCLARGLRIGWIDPMAEASELPDHSRSALLLRVFGDGWASFFVTDSLVQDQPNQPTLSMGNGPDDLVMSQARDRAPIHNLED